MRALATALGWELVTPPKANRRQPWKLNRKAYRRRNAIERYFGRIKAMRGVHCQCRQRSYTSRNRTPHSITSDSSSDTSRS